MEPFTYTNRRSKTWYFSARTTKTGKTAYTASRKKPEAPLHELPEGYEVYENHNAQVFLRRIDAQAIRTAEVDLVRRIIGETTALTSFWVERNKDAIIVSTGSDSGEVVRDLFGGLSNGQVESLAGFLGGAATLMPMLRFILKDDEHRLFQAQRYCFRGGIDDWVTIYHAGIEPLDKLARQFCPHLEGESFYDLI